MMQKFLIYYWITQLKLQVISIYLNLLNKIHKILYKMDYKVKNAINRYATKQEFLDYDIYVAQNITRDYFHTNEKNIQESKDKEFNTGDTAWEVIQDINGKFQVKKVIIYSQRLVDTEHSAYYFTDNEIATAEAHLFSSKPRALQLALKKQKQYIKTQNRHFNTLQQLIKKSRRNNA